MSEGGVVPASMRPRASLGVSTAASMAAVDARRGGSIAIAAAIATAAAAARYAANTQPRWRLPTHATTELRRGAAFAIRDANASQYEGSSGIDDVSNRSAIVPPFTTRAVQSIIQRSLRRSSVSYERRAPARAQIADRDARGTRAAARWTR